MLEGDYREPLMVDEDGLYITVAQINFFLNRKNGEELIDHGSPEFLKYYRNCCLYNLVYDMMEEDPSCGSMYWDDLTESVAMAFPMDGKVSRALAAISLRYSQEDDDEFGLFS